MVCVFQDSPIKTISMVCVFQDSPIKTISMVCVFQDSPMKTISMVCVFQDSPIKMIPMVCVFQDSPIKMIQMIWLNLTVGTLGSLALATETPTVEIRRRKPYGRIKFLLSPNMMKNVFGHSMYQMVVILSLLFAGA